VRDPIDAPGRLDRHAMFKRFRSGLRGQMIMPEDADYDKARKVFNRWVDRRPSMVVKAADASDVVRVVNYARDMDLRLAIRSGGHDIGGYSVVEGGIVLDLRGLNTMEIDPTTRTAWAGAGLTAGEYTLTAAKLGLATGFGDTATVGIGGITLGGGVGYLVRKHGLTIDHLLAAELVTADGQLLRIDADRHPDLFWAIRGGGGNFGVVTRFRFKLHPLSHVFGGILLLPATVDTLCSFFAEAEAAPEELSIIANVMHAPPLPFIPQGQVGKPMIMAMMVYAGDIDAGGRAVDRFRRLGVPIADMLRPMSYPEMYQLGGPEPASLAVRSLFLDTIDLHAAEEMLSHLQASATPMAMAQIRVLGGAMARIPHDATSFVHRTRKVMVGILAMYDRPEDRPVHETWATGFAAALGQGVPGVYVNFLGDEGAGRVREAYPGPTWDRLREVKRRYDPTNLFRLNQNIPPATD
jgi:FAD/FMN-containing dehydrogenase